MDLPEGHMKTIRQVHQLVSQINSVDMELEVLQDNFKSDTSYL